MNPYEWTTEELPDGREKVIILRDKYEKKDWGTKDSKLLKPPEDNIIDERQKKVDELNIKEGFLEVK
jgi:hypothetical protein